MFSIYLGISAVIWSVFAIQHPKGKEHTPPISPTMQCVINLTVQFFFIYLLLSIFLTLEQFSVNMPGQAKLKNSMEAARQTVQYAPMLAILFVATRMRALQITQQRGAPQGWAQDGNVISKFENPIGVWTVTIMKYLGLLLLYGG